MRVVLAGTEPHLFRSSDYDIHRPWQEGHFVTGGATIADQPNPVNEIVDNLVAIS
jgi:hypothetical protein